MSIQLKPVRTERDADTISVTVVRRSRAAASLTQCDFARLLGVHPITVSKWETGRAIPTPWQTEIARAVESSPDRAAIGAELWSNGVGSALALALRHLLPNTQISNSDPS